MLLEFSVENYLSFKSVQSLIMQPAGSVKEHESSVIRLDGDTSVLKFAVLYGANGSGKTNLLKSIVHMREAVLHSFTDDTLIARLSDNVYCFDPEENDRTGLLEINFEADGTFYRYGFEFKNGKVAFEWLYKSSRAAGRESYCFTREGASIRVNPKTYKGAGGLADMTRDDTLFLSLSAHCNVEVALRIKKWFEEKLLPLGGTEYDCRLTLRLWFTDPRKQEQILSLVRYADSSIRGIEIVEGMNGDPNVYVLKGLFKGAEKIGTLRVPLESESSGVRHTFALAGFWISAIENGATLLVDDFGALLHPKLSEALVASFTDNAEGAGQLIAVTHDTHLLRNDLLRRDQIWFSEKDGIGKTGLYSLVEYKIDSNRSVRNDASFEKDYLSGRYGASPVIRKK